MAAHSKEKTTDSLYLSSSSHPIEEKPTMAAEMSLLMLKLKLLASGGGHCHIHVALLWFFLLKLPLVARMRASSYANMALTVRLFFFRLSRVLSSDAAARSGRRWERALRLLWQRAAAADGRTSNDESFHSFSMLAL
ncbi:hypothetical protein AXF42_Ash001998 [Apostasia shenzhenica]|uniref:Uncharacterized protein n=1 Tax=Apostasia shenzhenica TaxID=1088818 RepID=A0A2I0ABU5_9ASPA|nr:hypothetical protein AXF42_Ash001998 [Apostasia shenzhenica]